jgi:hypothetical protein
VPFPAVNLINAELISGLSKQHSSMPDYKFIWNTLIAGKSSARIIFTKNISHKETEFVLDARNMQ